MQSNLEYLKKYYKGNLDDAIKRLNNGEPVQYIVGNVDFYGYILDVNSYVLIPRRETEELTEKVLKRIQAFSNPVMADIGTGSGAIAIVLSKKLNKHIYASDISEKALEVAKINSKNNNSNITFLQGDMLKPYIKKNIKLDVIVSNPPYIKEDEKIEEIVKNNEPNIALYAKNKGLEYYDSILKDASKVLNDKFLIAFEIGESQANDIKKLAYKYFKNVNVDIEKDLSFKDRFIFVYNY